MGAAGALKLTSRILDGLADCRGERDGGGLAAAQGDWDVALSYLPARMCANVLDHARLERRLLECEPQEPIAFREYAGAAEPGHTLLQTPLLGARASPDPKAHFWGTSCSPDSRPWLGGGRQPLRRLEMGYGVRCARHVPVFLRQGFGQITKRQCICRRLRAS